MASQLDQFVPATADGDEFESAFNHAALGMALIGLNGRFQRVNAALCRLVGYSEAELLARDIQSIVHPADLVEDRELRIQLMAGEITHYQHDKRYLRRDGSQVWGCLHLALARDAGGRPRHFIAQVQDLTERRQDEARYRLLAENISDVVGLFDLDGRCRFISPSLEKLLGYTPEELIGRTIDALVEPTAFQDLRAAQRRLMTSPPGTEVIQLLPLVGKEGQRRWGDLAARLAQDEDGNPVVVAITRDITDRVETEQRYQRIAESATDIIVETGLDGRLVFVSPAVEAITGWSVAELIGRRPMEFAHPDDRSRLAAAFQLLLVGEPVVDRVRWRVRDRADSRWIWLESHPTLLPDPRRPNEPRFLDVIRDVTVQVEQEAQLERATRDAEEAAAIKSEFLANMSHEIRTPLTAVLGYANLLEGMPELPGRARDYVGRLRQGGQALLALINDILDFSKLEAGDYEMSLESTPVASLGREMIALFEPQAEEKGIGLSLQAAPPDDLCLLLANDRLRQILGNLISNAIKFTESGGVWVRLAYRAPDLIVEVEDSGPGIALEDQEKLFRRFSQVDASSTRRHGGTGLGLAICKGLAEAMGGWIEVHSEPGRGATFSVSLPAEVAETAAPTPTMSPTADLTGVKVLVADDNAANRELVRVLLTALGAEVAEAVDGPDAVARAQEAAVDVILMDFRMPGFDGPEALRRIREAPGPNQFAAAVAFTASDANEEAVAEFDSLVTKPVDMRRLATVIAEAATRGASTPRRRLAEKAPA